MSQAVHELLEPRLDKSSLELGFSKQAELKFHFRARLINEPNSSLEVLGLFIRLRAGSFRSSLFRSSFVC
ncbi:hypothetical protein M6B38_245150 [Iris pallida]|uniref:Uncharacterized protein n=1 Tax=Iris pallida TaxID=29817 RepID=A0AAX6DI94_IRIPA|nr:hypothetical protein M6B38_245150 [Iris pallida]